MNPDVDSEILALEALSVVVISVTHTKLSENYLTFGSSILD